jgi:hypothetical protein
MAPWYRLKAGSLLDRNIVFIAGSFPGDFSLLADQEIFTISGATL